MPDVAEGLALALAGVLGEADGDFTGFKLALAVAIGEVLGNADGDGDGDGSAASATAATIRTAIAAPTSANLFMVALLLRFWSSASLAAPPTKLTDPVPRAINVI